KRRRLPWLFCHHPRRCDRRHKGWPCSAPNMTAIARLVKWSYLEGDVSKGAPYPPCTGSHRRAVCIFGAGDLRWILHQHHLLANKFDPQVDDVALKCLETHLRYKALYGKSM
uniref:Uncharacterized protein n=1 Tax=Paramormyrops kingsleyae TaxID=1676925 RepID=A0A3B3S2K3_9TELE